MPTPVRVSPGPASPAPGPPSRGSVVAVRISPAVWPYIQIARVDHWFKNAFMALGVLFAFFYVPEKLNWSSLPLVATAFIATCLVASSNYVINELLDGPRDALHPLKRHRPVTIRRNVGDGYHVCLRVRVARSGRLYCAIEGWWRAPTAMTAVP